MYGIETVSPLQELPYGNGTVPRTDRSTPPWVGVFAPQGQPQISPGQSAAPPWDGIRTRRKALKGRHKDSFRPYRAPAWKRYRSQGVALGWFVGAPSGRKSPALRQHAWHRAGTAGAVRDPAAAPLMPRPPELVGQQSVPPGLFTHGLAPYTRSRSCPWPSCGREFRKKFPRE